MFVVGEVILLVKIMFARNNLVRIVALLIACACWRWDDHHVNAYVSIKSFPLRGHRIGTGIVSSKKLKTFLCAKYNSENKKFEWEDWWETLISTARSRKSKRKYSDNEGDKRRTSGTIRRCAARNYQGKDSTPFSSNYTTRKNSFDEIFVNYSGVVGDYNHYRTVALSNTTDRAISILTTDVLEMLRKEKGPQSAIQVGDLGENILVDGLNFDDFYVGQKYKISGNKRRSDHELNYDDDDVDKDCFIILKITEPIVPCANLCKLSFINNPDIEPKDKIERCKCFLERLAEADGLRGWYAKVENEGTIAVGSAIELIIDTD